MKQKKQIIVFGAGNEGKLFKRMIDGKCSGLEDIEVIYYCDNHTVAGNYVEGIKTISAYQLNRLEKYDIYICASKHLDEIMTQLYKMKVKNRIYFVPEYTYKFMYNAEMPFAIKMDISKPRMPYLECKIVDFCNLNCKGCSAYANICEKTWMDIDKFEEDCNQLKKLFSGIGTFKLFGGEPLLHPELEKFIVIARKKFPDSNLQIHSNGILIGKCSENLMKECRNNDVEFVFTLYPETGKVKRNIEQILAKHNIRYNFTPPVYEFRKAINKKGDWNAEEVYKNCCKCINLFDGNVACGMPFLIEALEKKYDVKICDNVRCNTVNIYTTDMNGWQINKLLDSPYHLCSYCAFMRFNVLEDGYYYSWTNGVPKLSDWILE